MDDMYSNIKIVIIGQPSVGKTSLRRAYIGEKFRTNYIETIGSDFSFKQYQLENGKDMGLAIWDIAGQDKFSTVHPVFYKGSYACVVVYSVLNRESYDLVPMWIEKFIEYSNRPNLPLMIIGNKTDRLAEERDYISLEEHHDLVQQITNKYPDRSILDIRTSAKTGKNVDKGFSELSHTIHDWIVENIEQKGQGHLFEDDIDQSIPGAYALLMNQIEGPQILASVPSQYSNIDEIAQLSNSAIKLIASLDFNDVITQSSIISTFPWVYPRGIFHYIAFVLDNDFARGNKELFLIGINIDRTLVEPMSGIKGIINGFLHSSMNDFASLSTAYSHDLVTQIFKPNEHVDFVNNVKTILQELRQRVHDSYKRWYNIP